MNGRAAALPLESEVQNEQKRQNNTGSGPIRRSNTATHRSKGVLPALQRTFSHLKLECKVLFRVQAASSCKE